MLAGKQALAVFVKHGKQTCGVWAPAIRRRDNELGKKQAVGGVGRKPTIDFLKLPTAVRLKLTRDEVFHPSGGLTLTVSQWCIFSVTKSAVNKVSHFQLFCK